MDQHAGRTPTNSQTSKTGVYRCQPPHTSKAPHRQNEELGIHQLQRADPILQPWSRRRTRPEHQPGPLPLPRPRSHPRGHKLTYSFPQWANCFITYIAALAVGKTSFICAQTFKWSWRPVESTLVVCGSSMTLNTGRRPKQHATRIGQLSTLQYSASALRDEPSRHQGTQLAAPSDTKHSTALAGKLNGRQQMRINP